MWRPRIPRALWSLGLLVLAGGQYAFAANGDSFCADRMCASAMINGAETIYTLNTTLSYNNFGWMAVGFGEGMAGSPMVILWANSDGSITLSQRAALAHVQPQVVATPPRVASLRTDLSTLTGSAITLTFTMPSTGETTQNMIYGLSTVKPSSSDVGANLQQHNFNGAFQLDLTQTVPDITTASASGSATGTASATSSALAVPTQGGSNNDPSLFIAYSTREKKFIAHGILSALGFCFFLPIGVLQARLLRVWWPRWFTSHWIVQAGLAGPCIVAGFALAVSAVAESKGSSHFDDKHMIIGLVLFLLYVCQALYGLVIHLIKSPNRKRRPVQNYGHAILGLGLIALALYQVWLGFNEEWTTATGRDKPKRGLRIFWIVWIAVLGGAYIIGLALLPKQYKTEQRPVRSGEKALGTNNSDDDVHPMTHRHS